VVVSGESGAGKTETVKLLMNHIANISQHTNDYTIEKVLLNNPIFIYLLLNLTHFVSF
jgi:myosin-5